MSLGLFHVRLGGSRPLNGSPRCSRPLQRRGTHAYGWRGIDPWLEKLVKEFDEIAIPDHGRYVPEEPQG